MLEKPRTIRIREDQLATIKELNINFSKWVRERFDEEFSSHESITNRITNCQKELQKLQKIEKFVLQNIIQKKNISAEKRKFLQETNKLLKNHPEFLPGRIQLYKNKFGITERLSKNDFLEILESIK